MGQFTVFGKKEDEKIREDLRTITDIIVRKTSPISIILFGGFGKGEGSIEIKNSKIKPINDYDLYIVGKRKVSEDELDSLRIECSRAIGRGGLDFVENPEAEYDKDKFFHADTRFIHYDKLGRLPPMQRTFELKYGSQVIYGENVLPKINDVKVPVSDAIRILFNKMDHLLLSKFQKNKLIKTIYIYKAYCDLASALLIAENDFRATYRQKAEAIQKHDFPSRLKKKILWATELRMKPDPGKIKDINKEWEEAVYWVGYVFKFILKNSFRIKDDSWKGIARFVYNKLPYLYFSPYLKSQILFPLQYYLTLKYCLLCWKKGEIIIKPLFSWRDVGLKLAVPLFLYLYGEEKEAEKYLKKITSRTKPLKERILYLYGLYYLQKIV